MLFIGLASTPARIAVCGICRMRRSSSGVSVLVADRRVVAVRDGDVPTQDIVVTHVPRRGTRCGGSRGSVRISAFCTTPLLAVEEAALVEVAVDEGGSHRSTAPSSSSVSLACVERRGRSVGRNRRPGCGSAAKHVQIVERARRSLPSMAYWPRRGPAAPRPAAAERQFGVGHVPVCATAIVRIVEVLVELRQHLSPWHPPLHR